MPGGAIMLDANGNIMLDAFGNIMLDDGSTNDCCCTHILNIANATAAAPVAGPGTVPMNFVVTLSHASTMTVTVTYGTMQGTASAGHLDYDGITPTVLTFPPGSTSQTIVVNIEYAKYPSTTYDPPYTPSHPGVYFYVLLSLPVNATIGIGTGIGTITY